MKTNECRGHESTNGPIGNVVYCDGSCRPRKNKASSTNDYSVSMTHVRGSRVITFPSHPTRDILTIARKWYRTPDVEKLVLRVGDDVWVWGRNSETLPDRCA